MSFRCLGGLNLRKIIVIIFIVYFIASFAVYLTKNIGDKVAVIPIKGVITTGNSFIFETTISPNEVIDLLDKAEKDPSVKAIVIEIDSPGGTPVACAEIAEKIKKVNKPVVAWLGEVATSGAYWVASASDFIVAHPLTITGSIGAYTVIGDLSGLYEKLGINFTVVKSAEYKDIGSSYRPPTREEIEKFQYVVNKIHKEFVKEIAENRGLNESYTTKLANGLFYLGEDAKKLGLVDELGTREDAIEIAKKMSNATDAKVVEFAPEKSFMEEIKEIITKACYILGYGVGQGIKNSGSVVHTDRLVGVQWT